MSKSGSSSRGGTSTTVLRLGGSALGGAVGLSGRLGTTGLTFGASGFGGGPTLGAIFGPGGVTFGTVSRGGGPPVRAGGADPGFDGDAGGGLGTTGVPLGAGRGGTVGILARGFGVGPSTSA